MPLVQSIVFGIINSYKKVKSPYFTSIAWTIRFTNKPVADGALILSPLPPPPLFYRYLKLLETTTKGKKTKEWFVVTPWNLTWDPSTQKAAH